MTEITLETAELLLRAAKSKAASIGIAASIAVLDAGGNLKAFVRMNAS
jgi:uncharacterized protein GlcG (DUF336 family)